MWLQWSQLLAWNKDLYGLVENTSIGGFFNTCVFSWWVNLLGRYSLFLSKDFVIILLCIMSLFVFSTFWFWRILYNFIKKSLWIHTLWSFTGTDYCQDPDLNWRHEDFQSTALPTELSRHLVWSITSIIYCGPFDKIILLVICI